MGNMMSVVTVNLKTEPWQRDVMDKRFELCRNVYNAMLGYEIKKYGRLTRNPRYTPAKETIDRFYKAGKGKSKDPELVEAKKIHRELLKEYSFSEFDFINDVAMFYKDKMDYTANIYSTLASLSIAKPMWAAYEKLLFGNGKHVHYKKRYNFVSVASDGRSGIRLVDANDATVHTLPDDGKMWLVYGSRKGKILKMPVVIDEKDIYAKEALSHRIKILRITKDRVKGKSFYQLQATVEGAPPTKYNKETGEVLHPVGSGRVGVYIDTRCATICTQDGIISFSLLDGIINFEEKRADINRYLDASKRLSNPENYNENGTIKNGRMENGKRVKLHWDYSNNYCKARARRAELYRKERVQRHIRNEILSNLILSKGDEFIVNDYPFYLAAMRKKEDEQKKDGTPKSKAKAGKAIGTAAPATVIQLLDQKLKSRGYAGVTKVKLSEVDKTLPDYRSEYAKMMYNHTESLTSLPKGEN